MVDVINNVCKNDISTWESHNAHTEKSRKALISNAGLILPSLMPLANGAPSYWEKL